jgi:serine/threonine-protein kinase
VLDFGLAKVTEQQMRPGSIQLTQEGMVFGTPEFMSPEQAQGKTLDARSDIYSLAIILYEAITGKLPFEARTPMEFIQKHVMDAPIPLNDRIPGMTFPDGLWTAISVALAKTPDARFQSAMEFASALRPFAGANNLAVDSVFQMTPGPPSIAAVSLPEPALAPQSGQTQSGQTQSGQTQRVQPLTSAAPQAVATAAAPKSNLLMFVAVAAVFLLIGAGATALVLTMFSK